MFKGKLPDAVLASLLETLPLEFSIVDANDKVLAWNRHETRVFRRTDNVLGRDVRACHPGKSLAKVEAIISEMKKGHAGIRRVLDRHEAGRRAGARENPHPVFRSPRSVGRRTLAASNALKRSAASSP